jgi:hypothetical protein
MMMIDEGDITVIWHHHRDGTALRLVHTTPVDWLGWYNRYINIMCTTRCIIQPASMNHQSVGPLQMRKHLSAGWGLSRKRTNLPVPSVRKSSPWKVHSPDTSDPNIRITACHVSCAIVPSHANTIWRNIWRNVDPKGKCLKGNHYRLLDNRTCSVKCYKMLTAVNMCHHNYCKFLRIRTR